MSDNVCGCVPLPADADIRARFESYNKCKRKFKHFEQGTRASWLVKFCDAGLLQRKHMAESRCTSSTDHARSDDLKEELTLYEHCPFKRLHFGPSSSYARRKKLKEFEKAGLRITRPSPYRDEARARAGRARRTKRYMDTHPEKRAIYLARYWGKKLATQPSPSTQPQPSSPPPPPRPSPPPPPPPTRQQPTNLFENILLNLFM